MGQAKSRGSYEQRKQKALDEGRIKTTVTERKAKMREYLESPTEEARIELWRKLHLNRFKDMKDVTN